MPSVYTIEGHRKRRKGRTRQQSRLARAAKACKGRRKGAFRACVREHMRRSR